MDPEIKSLLDELTEATLDTLKLQMCWQIARQLDIPYNRHHSAETLRSLIRDRLFPKSQVMPELDSEDSFISQFKEVEIPRTGTALNNEVRPGFMRPYYSVQSQIFPPVHFPGVCIGGWNEPSVK